MKCNLYFLFGFYWNLYPVLKSEPHIFLAVDRHKIHHGVLYCIQRITVISFFPRKVVFLMPGI